MEKEGAGNVGPEAVLGLIMLHNEIAQIVLLSLPLPPIDQTNLFTPNKQFISPFISPQTS